MGDLLESGDPPILVSMNRSNSKKLFPLVTIIAMTMSLCISCAPTWRVPTELQPAPGDSPRVQDLKFFCTTLPQSHKNFFADTSHQVYNAACLQALEQVDTMSDLDFYFTLSRLAAMAGDSHTRVGLTPEVAAQAYAIPGQIGLVDGRWRLTVVEASLAELLGAEVVAINGIPMEEITERASVLYGHDNETRLLYSIAQQLNLTQLYAYLGIAKNYTDDVSLTVIPLGTTRSQTVVVAPVSGTEFYKLSLVPLVTSQPETGRNGSVYRALLLGEGDVFFIQYNACVSWDQMPIEDFTDQVLTLIHERRPKQVIVDLRYNGGGNSALFEPMIDGLAELQAQQGFPIDVLIGQETFSSALINAVQLKHRTDSRLVGSPTGGSVNHYGEVQTFALPNSGITVSYSTKYFTMDKSYPSGSLQPDLSVQRTVEDLRNGIDTEEEAILSR